MLIVQKCVPQLGFDPDMFGIFFYNKRKKSEISKGFLYLTGGNK